MKTGENSYVFLQITITLENIRKQDDSIDDGNLVVQNNNVPTDRKYFIMFIFILLTY